jgi:hypothetical protein
MILVGWPEGKRPLGIDLEWRIIIKRDLQEVGGARGDCMEMAENWGRWQTLVCTVLNF